ncbi:MAG: flavodoxin-dependent (E)-4-hydroxy-3-methylbut-2-enyl-diphosphate synthase [Eubacteriales bacterium]|nr:flavodoxin-dependent (E)-4-hydroxy-3-methylbut-2-enyl-diphosphate synthase [Eubacteriales bacterium]
MRRKTRTIQIGNRLIGGAHPILIQSMCNTKTHDVAATVAQIHALERVGCEMVRVAVPNRKAADALAAIRRQIHIPLVADIHFDYKLALRAMDSVDKLRINPGNIGHEDRVRAVIDKAKERRIPIRIGVNSGSLSKDILERDGGVTAAGLAESALREIAVFEKYDYDNFVLSVKSSDVRMAVAAHEILARKTDCPLHIGITESGTVRSGTIKSSVGLGILLHQGIGDTIRVSLTGDPVAEIGVAKRILRSLGLRKGGVEVVSCPTCGRTAIDLIPLAEAVEDMVADLDIELKVAVMGCVVNGPGEAREADIGIAGGNGVGVIIKRGEILKKVREEELLSTLRAEILNWREE